MARVVELVVAIGVDGARDAVAEIQKLEGAVVKSVKVTENLGKASSTAGKQTTDALGIAGTAAYKFGQQWQQVMSSIGTTIGPVVVALGTLKKGIDFSKEGASILRLEESSGSLARSVGLNMESIVADVRSASLGMVSNFDIMQSSSRALMLEVGASSEDLAGLMEVAAVRGRAMGLDTTQAFDDIITGIGRMSPQILDNLGIVTDADATYQAYAANIGKVATQLTAAEKKQALLNRVLKESQGLLRETGGLTLDSAGQWEKLSASWDNMMGGIKKGVAQGPILWFVESINKAFDMAEKDAKNLETINLAKNLGLVKDYEMIDIEAPTRDAQGRRERLAARERERIEKFMATAKKAAAATQEWADANDRVYGGELLSGVDTFTDLANSIVNYKTQLADATSIGKNFSAIVGYAKTYDAVITDLNAKEAEYARLRNLGWSETSQKMQTLNGEIEGLKGQLTASANQMTLDMMQATIAIGGVTEAEMGAYFDMAVAMGAVSRQGADAAMAAYQNAVDQINAYALDPKTMIIDVQANALNMVLAELEAERLRDLIVNFKANTEPISDARTQLENAETLEITAEFMVDQLGFREEVSAIEAEEFLATIGLKGETTQFDKSLKLALDLVPKELTVWLKGEWMGISDPPLPSGAYGYRGGYLSPDKAIGGPVYPGKSYLWQEPGREGELLIPEKYGRVMSNVEVAQAMREALIMSASANSGQGNTTTTNSNNVTYNVNAMYKEEPVLTLSEHLRIMATLEGRA